MSQPQVNYTNQDQAQGYNTTGNNTDTLQQQYYQQPYQQPQQYQTPYQQPLQYPIYPQQDAYYMQGQVPPVYPQQPPQYEQTSQPIIYSDSTEYDAQKKATSIAIIFFIVGFCIWPLWILSFIFSRKSNDKCTRICGAIGLALIFVEILSFITVIVTTVV